MKSVLILEDDVFVAMDLAMLVEEAGTKAIGPCYSVQSAMNAAARHRPDFALIDFNLGNHTSSDFADWLAGHAIPYAFLTGLPASQLSGRDKTVCVLEKPVSKTELVRILQAL